MSSDLSKPGEQDAHFEMGAKNRKVFALEDDIFGLPCTVFGVGVAISLGFSILLFSWSGFVIALLYFVPMYAIHRDDPRAIRVWLNAYFDKTSYWVAGKNVRHELIIL